MRTEQLTNLIHAAKVQEINTSKLAYHLEKMTDGLHSSVVVTSGADAISALSDFVIRYVEHTPEYLSLMAKAAAEANIMKLVIPLIKFSEDFFLDPPEIIGNDIHLERLMESAYLCHRLIEEVNDRFFTVSGKALVPIDIITANLIVHNLIGEPFVNQLDEFCTELAKEIIEIDTTDVSDAGGLLPDDEKRVAWINTWTHWSEIMGEKNVRIQL